MNNSFLSPLGAVGEKLLSALIGQYEIISFSSPFGAIGEKLLSALIGQWEKNSFSSPKYKSVSFLSPAFLLESASKLGNKLEIAPYRKIFLAFLSDAKRFFHHCLIHRPSSKKASKNIYF